jgi:hypothetical protein
MGAEILFYRMIKVNALYMSFCQLVLVWTSHIKGTNWQFFIKFGVTTVSLKDTLSSHFVVPYHQYQHGN